MFPRLHALVTAMSGTVGPYPSLRYSVLHVIHHTAQDIDPLLPLPPKNVIQEEKNRRVIRALTDIAGHLSYAEHPDPAVVGDGLADIGRWIAANVLPPEVLCCCNGGLPQTVEVFTDQHEIPWELTWVKGDFLARQVMHARYPFVARTRHHDLLYSTSVDTSKPATTWTGKTGHHEDSGRDSLVFTA